MSIDTRHTTERPPLPPPGTSSWTQMETRLIAAQVGDLLERASVRLGDLTHLEGLAADTLDQVAAMLAALERHRGQVARIRHGPPPEAPGSPHPDKGIDHRSVVPPLGAGST